MSFIHSFIAVQLQFKTNFVCVDYFRETFARLLAASRSARDAIEAEEESSKHQSCGRSLITQLLNINYIFFRVMKNARSESSAAMAPASCELAASRAREDKSRIIKLHSSTVPPLCTERRTYLDSSREGDGREAEIGKLFFSFKSSKNFSLCCKKL